MSPMQRHDQRFLRAKELGQIDLVTTKNRERIRTYGTHRRCNNCSARLSRYNPEWLCAPCLNKLKDEVKEL